MVMADIGDRGRRRRRRGGRKEFPEREMMAPPMMPMKPPTILAKPVNHTIDTIKHVVPSETMNGPEALPQGGILIEKPPILLKARTENHRHESVNGTSGSDGGGMGVESPGSPPVYSIQRPPPVVQRVVTAQDNVRINTGPVRLAAPPTMTRGIKLVDDCFNWCESGMEMLLDQTDFLVVGVLGLQGVGKSFILSHLSDGEMDPTKINLPFRPQQRDMREVCGHQTAGIDIYVTSERTIYLDCQPMLSSSILHNMIQHDKKYPTEFSSAENCIEIQSLQIASFMLTVCNVVLVVADWFIDTNFMRFLRTAEMLKPPTPGHDNTVVDEYFPHVVIVMNKADRDDFSVETYSSMQTALDTMMDQSKLKYQGGINMAGCRGLSGLTKRTVQNKLNLCLIPEQDNPETGNGVLALMPNYRGHPGFDSLINSLRSQLLAIPRHLLTHTTLSEKNWFHYAARTWDGVKKSQMYLEYNRLLP